VNWNCPQDCFDAPNLADSVENAGKKWAAYEQSMPAPSNSGMRQGHLVAVNYNNHYSLLRTIENSLGLPPLTNNDKFAQPMNEYWP
jgi:hypothetical protein